MSFSSYGPQNVKRIAFDRLPKGIRDAGISKIERKLRTGTVTDLVTISDQDWHVACRRFNAIKALEERPGRLARRISDIANMFAVTERTVKRWLSVFRKDPDIVALVHRHQGQRHGTRRLKPETERLLGDVIDIWAARAERLPVSWIVAECSRRTLCAAVRSMGLIGPRSMGTISHWGCRHPPPAGTARHPCQGTNAMHASLTA